MIHGTDTPAPGFDAEAFDAEELLALARLDIEKGNIADALWRLKKAAARERVPTGAFGLCGQLYIRLGLWDHALKMLEKHLERDPEALGEKFSLGLVHGNSGRAAEATRIWSELLDKQPHYAPALYYRALVHAREGQVVPAKRDLEVLIQSAAANDPYLKPGKELLQSLDARQSSVFATIPVSSASESHAALARKAYAAG